MTAVPLARRDALLAVAGLGAAAAPLALASRNTSGAVAWDLSLPWGLSEFHTANALRFADAVRRETAGALDIAVHGGAVLGIKGQDSLRAAAQGVVALSDVSGFQQVGIEPILGMEALPLLIDTQAQLALLYQELRPLIEAVLARRGVRLVYLVPWPNQYMYTKRAVEKLSDLAPARLRTQDAITSALAEALGLIPIQMASADVVAALATSAIDATMTSTTTASSQKYWNFLSHAYRTNHIWATNFMVAHQASWDALPATLQQTVTRIAQRMEPQFWAVSRDDDARQRAVLESHGMIVREPPPAMRAELLAIARPMWQAFARATPEAAPVLRRFLARTGRTL